MADSNSHIRYLDGWRGCAIILVLIGHFGPQQLLFFGPLGVVLFFVLSGFFMGNLLFIKKVSLVTFFVRRISRIIPALWVYISAMYIYSKYFLPTPYDIPASELLFSYTFLGTYLPLTTSIWAINWPNAHLWSLNVEEHSYIYLGIGALFVRRFSGIVTAQRFMIATVLIVLLINVLYVRAMLTGIGASPWRLRTESACLGLMASAAYGLIWKKNWDSRWSESPAIPLVALLFAALGFIPQYHQNYAAIISPLAAAVAVNNAKNFPMMIKKLLSNKIICWFGACSFSIYLWQHPFYMLKDKFNYPSYWCLPAGIVFGAASFYLIENPARIHINKWWQRRDRDTPIKSAAV